MVWWQYALWGLAIYFGIGLTLAAIGFSITTYEKYVKKLNDPKESLGNMIILLTIPLWPFWVWVLLENVRDKIKNR